LGLVDTVTERSHAYRVLQPAAFVNQYAAMPSLHFGWDLLVGIAVVRNARAWYFRVVGLALPLAMAWAVVATANHFLIDCVAGAALALLALAVATLKSEQLDALQIRGQRIATRAFTFRSQGES
jgi:membrane-associated phospholipid phosphatase